MTRTHAARRCALLLASVTPIGAYGQGARADGVTFESVYGTTPASILDDPHYMSVEQFTQKAREGEKKGVYGDGKPIKLAFSQVVMNYPVRINMVNTFKANCKKYSNVTCIVTEGNGVAPKGIDPLLKAIGGGTLLGVPIPAAAMVFVVALFWWLMSQTVYGRNVYAVGANRNAARNIGVNVRIVECSVYVVIGVLAALAGYLTFARSGTFQPATAATGGTPVEVVIMAVAAVVLGGGSLVGGKGTVVGAFLGALVSAIMLNFLVLLGFGIWFQRFILALIIIAVVVVTQKTQRA